MTTVELDKKDRRLLYELDCNARASFAFLGKKLKMTPEAISYRYQRLQKEEILKSCFAVIDSGLLGFMQYKVFLKLQSVTEQDIKEIVRFARADPIVLRVMTFDGPFDLDLVCKVTNANDLDEFIVSLLGKFNAFIRKRSISVNAWARYLPRNYLVGSPRTKFMSRGYGTTSDRIHLDATDRFILKTLAPDARLSATDVAEALENDRHLPSISSYAVGKRIDALIRHKVIPAFCILLNNDVLDQMMFKVLLFVNSMSEAETKRFVDYCLRHSHIVHVMKTIGQWDYELDIEARDVKALHEILMTLTREFPRAVQDFQILNDLKVYKYRFVDES